MLLLMSKQTRGKPALAVGEKTPDNVRTFDGLRIAFPAAKFIHMLRDPRDCAVSGWYLGQRADAAQMREKFGDKAGYFRHYIDVWIHETVLGFEFGARHPHQYIEVHYADLLERSEAALQPVLGFPSGSMPAARRRGPVSPGPRSRSSAAAVHGEARTAHRISAAAWSAIGSITSTPR